MYINPFLKKRNSASAKDSLKKYLANQDILLYKIAFMYKDKNNHRKIIIYLFLNRWKERGEEV